MDWKDIGRMVGTAAPVVGGLLLGPAGQAAGSILATKLGVPATPDDLGRVLQGDPDALAKIKQIESEERIRFAELAAQDAATRIQADVADRDSARKREIAVHDLTPMVLAYGLTLIVFVLVTLIAVKGLPPVEQGRDAVVGFVSAVITAWAGAMSYYFGSSRGSDAKTVLLAKTTGSAP